MPGAKLEALHFNQTQVEAADSPEYWREATGVEDTNGWLTFVDPFNLNAEAWLPQWNASWPGKPVIGGFASGTQAAQTSPVAAAQSQADNEANGSAAAEKLNSVAA